MARMTEWRSRKEAASRKPSAVAFALMVCATLNALPARRAAAQTMSNFHATVLSIGDGDTLRINRDGQPITIRLACIDAPETSQRPWGLQARNYLRQRLPLGQSIQVLPHGVDRYGRTVAELIHEININLVMVEDGQAFAYRRYLKECDAKAYLDAEYRASRHRFGVWQVEGGIERPWNFRHGQPSLLDPIGAAGTSRRTRCRQIASFARAQELLRQGHTGLDANGDGVACEGLPH